MNFETSFYVIVVLSGILFLGFFFWINSWFSEIKDWIKLTMSLINDPEKEKPKPSKFAKDMAKIYGTEVRQYTLTVLTHEQYYRAESNRVMWTSDYVVMIDKSGKAVIMKDRYDYPTANKVTIGIPKP